LHPGIVQTKSAADVAEWNALARATGDRAAVIDYDTQELERRARRAIQEYNLNAAGLNYRQQGYELPGGQVPLYKLYEHLVIAEAVHAAEDEKLKTHDRH